ncbi:hypothetical protein D3C72_583660 [compost metagenome]
MGFSLNPKKAFEAVVKAPAKAVNTLKDAGETAVDVAKAVPGVAKDVAVEGFQTAKYLADNPPNLAQVKRTTLTIGKAILTGKEQVMVGKMPPYDRPAAADLEAAKQRGEGRSIEQTFITGSKATSINEPVSLVVTGAKADLVKALQDTGWRLAPNRDIENYAAMGAKVLLGTERDTNGPLSPQHLDGKTEDMAFNKNDDYNAGRDHMRIYNRGKDPKTGEDVWAIAATRDTSAKITVPTPDVDLNPFDGDGLGVKAKAPNFTHTIDKDIDGERDLIMHDLLKSGFVKDWASVTGKRSGVAEEKLPDGRFKVDNDLFTDGRVYDVSLGR